MTDYIPDSFLSSSQPYSGSEIGEEPDSDSASHEEGTINDFPDPSALPSEAIVKAVASVPASDITSSSPFFSPKHISDIRRQMRTKYQPYPKKETASPLELRFTARLSSAYSGEPQSTADIEKRNEWFARVLNQLPDNIIRSVAMAKHATRERNRHRILLTAWEIEEAERAKEMLEGIQQQNVQEFCAAEEELEFFKAVLDRRNIDDLADDIHYRHAVYGDETHGFQSCDQQLNIIEDVVQERNIGVE
ncbi:hypothetical protein BJ138DRAFT_1165288 [Hygrophoropsis aurantiaca]|uniref:Uncharacterized protein n=1 Tax=Hygrophoropsis aurantiaca TaxID=72124 RepID=A0ACB7ZWS4_9AGAM|nr:hypothetical protein BJ138DRAFT_1165288 [Hygrophoropsis aurantiaca]